MFAGLRPAPLRATAFAAVLLALVAGLLVAPSVALLLMPAAALLALLANGVFLGEDVIERLRTRRAMARRPARPLSVRVPAAPAIIHRTGRRIAFALAVRPPPARLLLQH